jgi:hypothetical protein
VHARIIDAVEELVGDTPLLRLPLGGADTVVLAELEMTMLAAGNQTLLAKGRPPLARMEVAAEGGEFPLGLTGKSLKRFLRAECADLKAYLSDAAGPNLASTDALA